MYIIDAHQDIAYNMLRYRRDYRVSALKKRQLEGEGENVRLNGYATVGLPEAIAGRVALVFATIFTAPATSPDQGTWDAVSYHTIDEAYRLGMAQLDTYHQLEAEDERLRIVRTRADLDAVLATWAADVPISQRVQGLVLLMENADPIIAPEQFAEWYAGGLRLVGPAWQASRYAAGTGAPGDLTALGRELLDVMADHQAVLDLSHLAEAAFYQALDHYDGAIIASHSNPRRFCDTDRHLSDDMIRRLAERDGVMGVVLANHFLKGGWKRSDGKSAVTLDTALDVIDHVCQITGSSHHIGIGSDFDGGFGMEGVPEEIDTVADLWLFGERLAERGFSPEDVALVLHGNMLRKLKEGLA